MALMLSGLKATNSQRPAISYVVVEPETVLTTHVSHLMNKYAGELLGQDDVQLLLDNLSLIIAQPCAVCCAKAGATSFSDRHFA